MQAEQFEIWLENNGRWNLHASFQAFEPASAVFANRTYRQKLVRAVYENGRLVLREVIAEVGRTRETP
jgi:hypothetical protein